MTYVYPLWFLWLIISNYKPLQSYEHYPWPMFTRCYHSWIKQAILSHYNPVHTPHDPWTMFTRSDNSRVLTSNYPPLQSNSHDQWPMFTRCNTWEVHQGTISYYNPNEHYQWPMFTRCYHSLIKQAILSHYNPILIPHDPWTMFTRSNNS
jgi:hypothetical protein